MQNDYPPTPPAEQTADTTLPFAKSLPFVAGVLAGILLRLLFTGAAGSKWSAMAGAFIYLAPVVVGAVTVYVAETTQRRSWSYYFWAPLAANILFVFGTLVVMIEGLICAIVIVPLFAVCGGVGGLMMGIVCRVTDWPHKALYSLAVLPLALGLGGDYLPSPDVYSAVQRSVVVQATPEQIWHHINNASDIRPEGFSSTWAARIGVPMPLSGITTQTAAGRVRASRWEKAVHFDEPITHWQPGQYLRWTFRFDPTSFPPHALDDHVLIGGHYFDLRDTSFTLTPVPGGTRLDVAASYRVSTQFNFYADRVAQLLLGNMLETDLLFYKNRSEAVAAAQ